MGWDVAVRAPLYGGIATNTNTSASRGGWEWRRFHVQPALDNQELVMPLLAYWEGTAFVSGDAPGRAYVEMANWCKGQSLWPSLGKSAKDAWRSVSRWVRHKAGTFITRFQQQDESNEKAEL
jgi:hypothetical protein